jgi:glycosyltransferase involved in cell wall biosynthesis
MASAPREVRCLFVGVQGHGGEEVYSRALAAHPPAGVEFHAVFAHHSSCALGRCPVWAEVALNRLVYPWLAFDLGFRVLRVGDAADLVHVHTHPTRLLNRRGRPLVWSAGSSHVQYLRDYEGWSDARIRARQARARRVYRACGVADALLQTGGVTLAYTFSEWARRAYLEAGVAPARLRVLPPGFDIPAPAARPRRAPTFLFLGRQPRRKGGDRVLRAFAALREARPEARLLYVSDEPPVPAPPGVEARALVPPADVGALYAEADVLVNPTRAEGFGFTNAEAQGHGLPVISTRLAAIPEVIEHGVTGLLIAQGDDAALLQAMRALAEDRARREDLGAAARARFERLFARDVFLRGLRALYDEALALA